MKATLSNFFRLFNLKVAPDTDFREFFMLIVGILWLLIGLLTFAFASGNMSRKHKTAFYLCGWFGLLGIHRFYVGKRGTGLFMLFTLGGLGIWTLVDYIKLLQEADTYGTLCQKFLRDWDL